MSTMREAGAFGYITHLVKVVQNILVALHDVIAHQVGGVGEQVTVTSLFYAAILTHHIVYLFWCQLLPR